MRLKVNGLRIMAITVAVCSILAGCNAGKENPVLQQQKKSDKVKVNFWTHSTIAKEMQTQLINEFNAKNSDIEIAINMVSEKYGDMLNMAMATNEAPDIFSVQGPSLTKKAADMKWAEPLNNYIPKEMMDQFDERVWIEGNNKINGKIYTIPDQIATFRYAYNKDLFKKAGLDPENPPKTYAEFRNASKKVTEAGGKGITGFAIAMADGYYLDMSVFNGLGYYSLGTVLGYDYAKGEFDYKIYKPALQLVREMKKDGSMLEGDLLLKADQVRSKFANGEIGMIATASWEASIYNDLKPSFEIGIANWPSIDGKAKGKNTMQVGSGYAMCAAAKNKEAVWKALSFICSQDYTGKLNTHNGSISVFKNTNKDNTKYANPYVKYFLPNENDAVWPPLVPSLKMQGDNRTTIFTKLLLDPNIEMDADLEDLNRRTNEAYQKAVTNNEFSKDVFVKPGFDPLQLK